MAVIIGGVELPNSVGQLFSDEAAGELLVEQGLENLRNSNIGDNA